MRPQSKSFSLKVVPAHCSPLCSKYRTPVLNCQVGISIELDRIPESWRLHAHLITSLWLYISWETGVAWICRRKLIGTSWYRIPQITLFLNYFRGKTTHHYIVPATCSLRLLFTWMIMGRDHVVFSLVPWRNPAQYLMPPLVERVNAEVHPGKTRMAILLFLTKQHFWT